MKSCAICNCDVPDGVGYELDFIVGPEWRGIKPKSHVFCGECSDGRDVSGLSEALGKANDISYVDQRGVRRFKYNLGRTVRAVE